MVDFLELHKEKKKELSALNDRRDTDNELVTSFNYVLKDLNDRRIDDVLSVTMNNMHVFKAFVEASLNKADEKVVVESDDANFDTANVEDIIKRYYAQANHRRRRRGDPLIESYVDQQNVIRGASALRILTQEMPAKDGNEAFTDTDITTWDTRFMTHEPAPNDLAWAAYETEKSKGAIEGEAWARSIGYTIAERTATVIDIWTPEENMIYVGDDQVFSQPNPFGFVPVVFQGVPIGSMLADKDSLEFQMESIFFLVRKLINQYNSALSILQTLNLKAIKGATQQVVKPGEEAAEYLEANSMGNNTGVDFPNAISLVPFGDARNSMILALQEINKQMEAGTLSRITLGDLPGDLSAIALLQIEKGQGQVFLPRLGARGLLKQQGAEMFIRQIQSLGISSIELGTPGHKKTFNVSDLEGEYDIDFRYTNKDPDTEFARIRMSKELENILPELTILTDTMRRDDPEQDFRELKRQRAIQASPTLQKYEALSALAELQDQGDEKAAVELQLLELELNIEIEQLQAGNLPQQGAQPVPQGVSEGLRSSNEQASDLVRTAGDTVEG